MKIYINNHSFHYELENLVRVFFPNEQLKIVYAPVDLDDKPYIVTTYHEVIEGMEANLSVAVVFADFSKSYTQNVTKDYRDFDELCELTFAQILFSLLKEYTEYIPPWGVLTGVRPVKLFRSFAEQMGEDAAKVYFEKEFFVSKEKVSLLERTEKKETVILQSSKPNSFSLYVSIPFCPSRCSYCSFVSQSIDKAGHLIEKYVELLCEELLETAKQANALNLRLETVYVGGGTPTTLTAPQLSKIFDTIYRYFPMNTCREFTVEAGRPDTITEDKLKAILYGGVNRISINPQTLNDETLKVIGRNHTQKQTLEAYELARKVGFNHINMDVIAGLPKEEYNDFVYTLDKIINLDPESITVHTLSMKKASTLTEQGVKLNRKDATTAAQMHKFAEKMLPRQGYRPYYLYRQSRMVGNLENIGYAKNGHDGLYNVFIMDETHTIFGCGAGAVTKLKSPSSPYLKRIFNYKYPYEYINQFEEMINRKKKYQPFYREFT